MERDLGYEGSYDTVKRYVAQIKKLPPKAYMVLTIFLEKKLKLILVT